MFRVALDVNLHVDAVIACCLVIVAGNLARIAQRIVLCSCLAEADAAVVIQYVVFCEEIALLLRRAEMPQAVLHHIPNTECLLVHPHTVDGKVGTLTSQSYALRGLFAVNILYKRVVRIVLELSITDSVNEELDVVDTLIVEVVDDIQRHMRAHALLQVNILMIERSLAHRGKDHRLTPQQQAHRHALPIVTAHLYQRLVLVADMAYHQVKFHCQ